MAAISDALKVNIHCNWLPFDRSYSFASQPFDCFADSYGYNHFPAEILREIGTVFIRFFIVIDMYILIPMALYSQENESYFFLNFAHILIQLSDSKKR